MSNNDIKKGIAIQAKADAEKIEKLAQGLSAHRAVLSNLESGQSEIRDSIGIVLDDMSAVEAKHLYDLKVKKTPGEMDYTEKRVLCACVFTLLSAFNQDSENQRAFYSNLEKYLGVAERKNDFDFWLLDNVDSHTDRLVILKTICSFLFLKENSFAFLRDRDTYAWLFAFASVKDIGDVCSVINAEYAVLGAEGILGIYDPALALRNAVTEEFYSISTSDVTEIGEAPEEPAKPYAELCGLIIDALADEKSFGKGVAFSEKDLKRELPKPFSRVAFESLVAVTKIENGYLFFTTYALYLRSGGLFGGEYVCVPYNAVDVDRIITASGRMPGTRKIVIPVVQEETTVVTVDDNKLEEEKLRDLLISIKKSKCSIAETDRSLVVDELSERQHEELLSYFGHLFAEEELPLIDVYRLSENWGLNASWNRIFDGVFDDEDYESLAKHFLDSLVYPSRRDVAYETMRLLTGLASNANKILHRDRAFLSLKMEKAIRAFSVDEIDEKDFRILVASGVGSVAPPTHLENLSRKEVLSNEDLLHKELLVPFLDQMIKEYEARPEYKAKKTLETQMGKVAKSGERFGHMIGNLFKRSNNAKVENNKDSSGEDKK